jgi:hypothetical protein
MRYLNLPAQRIDQDQWEKSRRNPQARLGAEAETLVAGFAQIRLGAFVIAPIP